jgi:hypothetical protein
VLAPAPPSDSCILRTSQEPRERGEGDEREDERAAGLERVVRQESDYGIKELHESHVRAMSAILSRERKYATANTTSGSEMLRDTESDLLVRLRENVR